MDTPNDYIEESKREVLGLTDERFLDWLPQGTSIKVEFLPGHMTHDGTLAKLTLLDKLKEMFWDDFVLAMEDAYAARRG